MARHNEGVSRQYGHVLASTSGVASRHCRCSVILSHRAGGHWASVVVIDTILGPYRRVKYSDFFIHEIQVASWTSQFAVENAFDTVRFLSKHCLREFQSRR